MIRIKPTNYAARVEKDYDGCNEYVWFDSYYDWAIPETGDVNLGNMEILREWPRDFNGFWSENHEWFCGDEGGRIDGGSAYFNIAESILVARMFTDANRAEDDSIGQVDVAYPDPTSNGNAFENPFWDEIYLPPPNSYTDYLDYGFVDQVIVHEYAHHLEEEISENDMEFGQDHNFCTNIDEEFAWTEGFADFFSIFIGNKYRDDPAHYMSLVRQKFVKTETPDCYVNYAVEGGIEAVLWDLTDAVNASFPDSVNESFDTISGQEHLIMVIFDTEMDNYVDAPDICEFIWNGNGWMGRTRGSRLEYAINPMLDMYNITNDC
jgi:hypothetical protein